NRLRVHRALRVMLPLTSEHQQEHIAGNNRPHCRKVVRIDSCSIRTGQKLIVMSFCSTRAGQKLIVMSFCSTRAGQKLIVIDALFCLRRPAVDRDELLFYSSRSEVDRDRLLFYPSRSEVGHDRGFVFFELASRLLGHAPLPEGIDRGLARSIMGYYGVWLHGGVHVWIYKLVSGGCRYILARAYDLAQDSQPSMNLRLGL
ncbi:MAG: hypothetical protein KTR25_13910, partial [Myxococcales bacterium]|nr:hypothetical protein [Myxococcales bacterium]